jgi:valyl-tRNA synthetase
MLNNKNYLEKAPEAKVKVETEKYQNFKLKLQQLEEKLKNL